MTVHPNSLANTLLLSIPTAPSESVIINSERSVKNQNAMMMKWKTKEKDRDKNKDVPVKFLLSKSQTHNYYQAK